jgi:hypothetical protein
MKKILTIVLFGLLLVSGCSTIPFGDPIDERPPLINTNEFNNFKPYWDTNSVPNENWNTNGTNIQIIGDYHEST